MSLFKNHGTKLLGLATAAASVLSTVDPTVLHDAVGDKGMNYVTGFLGMLTILRGFQNSANQTQAPK